MIISIKTLPIQIDTVTGQKLAKKIFEFSWINKWNERFFSSHCVVFSTKSGDTKLKFEEKKRLKSLCEKI